MLAKALAKESGAAFINITAASMQSKWHVTETNPLCVTSSWPLGHEFMLHTRVLQDTQPTESWLQVRRNIPTGGSALQGRPEGRAHDHLH
jgi:hypothetical protein